MRFDQFRYILRSLKKEKKLASLRICHCNILILSVSPRVSLTRRRWSCNLRLYDRIGQLC